MIFEIIKSIIFGIVEGVTEWLPISSTGHLILLKEFLTLDVSKSFWEMYLVVIQLGAILAVCTVYFKKLNFFLYRKDKKKFNDTINLWFHIIVGCIPAGVFGILLDDYIDAHFFNFPTAAIALFVYGVLFIIVENSLKKKKDYSCNNVYKMSYKLALLIGLFQVLSLIPGTSRSGATIIGALLLGTDRNVAAEFAFYLAIPVMLGASFLKLLKFGFAFTSTEIVILLSGMIVAYVVSIIVIKFLLGYIKKNDFKPFGWYRIILGVILFCYYLLAIR